MKYITTILFILFGIIPTAAQYGNHMISYYHNGNKVTKEASPNYFLVYFDKNVDEKSITEQYEVSNIQQSIKKNTTIGFSCEIFVPSNRRDSIVHSLRTDPSVLFIEPAVGDEPVFSSRFFYVQLKNDEDRDILQQEANKIGAEVIREIPHADGWFSLSGKERCGKTSIELSNLMWETGLFRNVDPGFIPKVTFDNACVSDSKYESHQWNMQRINACDAWNISTGNSSVKVAVIDRGMRLDHVELTGLNLIYSLDLRPDNPSTPSVCHCDNIPYQPPHCHGAHVGGILFSNHNNGDIAGISPSVSALDFSIGLMDSQNDIPKLAAAIYGAVFHGAKVINNSWGIESMPIILESALDYAKSNNALLVFSAGNFRENLSHEIKYPSSIWHSALTVGASTSNDMRADFSCYGTALDVVAPGVDILSTWGTSSTAYHTMSGTSMAAPLVSGVAALMLSVRPELNAMQVHDIINATARKVNGSIYPYISDPDHPNGTWNEEMGYGLLDAHAAVRMAQTYNGKSDLMIRDHELDHGAIPSTDPILWNSPDIWLEDGGGYEIDNPRGGGDCFVCVRITNRSPIASSGGEELYINWAKAGCDLRWSSSWDGSTHFNCSNEQPTRGGCLNGGSPLIIPPIPAGGSCVLKMLWEVPRPEDYANCTQFESELWHFCLVARVHDGEDIAGENSRNYDMGRFVSESNNVAWKNVSVLDSKQFKAVVSISNPFEEITKFRIRVVNKPNKKGEYIQHYSDLIIQLDNELTDLWRIGGALCHGGIDIGGGRILVKDSVLLIENLKLPPLQHFTVETAIHFHTQTQPSENRFEFDLIQEYGSTVIGGEHYVAYKNPSILFRAGITLSDVDTDGNIALEAEDIGTEAQYILQSATGDTLGNNAHVSTRSLATQRIVLEVTNNENGYRDRDTLTLHPRLGAIISVSPNPVTGGQTEVICRLTTSLTGATLQIVAPSGTQLLTHPLAPAADGTATAILNLQGIPAGHYQLRLHAGTALLDARTLVVQ